MKHKLKERPAASGFYLICLGRKKQKKKKKKDGIHFLFVRRGGRGCNYGGAQIDHLTINNNQGRCVCIDSVKEELNDLQFKGELKLSEVMR